MRRMSVRIVPHRRRREQRTDHRQRLDLLKSGKPRLVVRASGSRITCQLVSHSSTGDRTLASANSLELKKLGWRGHTGNIPAAYLTGLLCGHRAKGKVREAVLDTGIHKYSGGSRVYAGLKGAIDSGLSVPHSGDVLPSEDRIRGGHIARYAELLKKEHPEKYGKRFSQYIKGSLPPEETARHFEEIKAKISGK